MKTYKYIVRDNKYHANAEGTCRILGRTNDARRALQLATCMRDCKCGGGNIESPTGVDMYMDALQEAGQL